MYRASKEGLQVRVRARWRSKGDSMSPKFFNSVKRKHMPPHSRNLRGAAGGGGYYDMCKQEWHGMIVVQNFKMLDLNLMTRKHRHKVSNIHLT